jgi:DNA-directed RNA polymerase subunit M/transcription elongation factor TFIIS
MEIGETSYLVITRIPHNEKDRTFLIEEAFSIYPIIRNNCPRCGYYDVQYWEAGDRRREEWESMTYYKCIQCQWVWFES